MRPKPRAVFCPFQLGKGSCFCQSPYNSSAGGGNTPRQERKIQKISGVLNCLISTLSYIVGFSSSSIPKPLLNTILLKLLDKALMTVTLGWKHINSWFLWLVYDRMRGCSVIRDDCRNWRVKIPQMVIKNLNFPALYHSISQVYLLPRLNHFPN